MLRKTAIFGTDFDWTLVSATDNFLRA